MVAAVKGKWTEPPCELRDDKWYGPPGYMILSQSDDGARHFVIACPRCGQLGAPREGQVWKATQGSFDDVTTLSLEPSIAKSCCGWHGYLRNGKFVEC